MADRYQLRYCYEGAPRGMAAVVDTAQRGQRPLAYVWPGQADWLVGKLNAGETPQGAPSLTHDPDCEQLRTGLRATCDCEGLLDPDVQERPSWTRRPSY